MAFNYLISCVIISERWRVEPLLDQEDGCLSGGDIFSEVGTKKHGVWIEKVSYRGILTA